uniref:NADH-ubiquinone oxidoreductase chain 4 n=1 Tax=Cheilomenes sexmaculata TaxID=158622 RepID=A0A0A0RZG7_9CUCU|nr:NADH dehydrogenase subunit 4 [Cheilomenes sexmaculata]QUQ05613.1 NADH dehydrogenase subunit 4 [Cheilomenes sexmaculata]QXM14776.1 NADH dehydrogenase subunit 4 [Cheilomenes sexmaculata]
MVMVLFLMFTIPLCLKNKFWLIKNLLVIFSLYFLMKNPFLSYSFISYFMGYDYLSYFLILLSFWVGFLMFMASNKVYLNKDFIGLFNLMVLFLLLCLVLTFLSMNMFMFYMFFEASLIPILVLIMGWGYQPERIQAGMYMFFYTIMASLPMMLFVFYYYYLHSSFSMNFIFYSLDSFILYFMMIMVFLVKLPMFLFHLWLPKAHVEASVAGSMVLAGVMLKLGSYGLIRFMMLFVSVGLKINWILINLSLLGGIIISLTCLRQSDLKSLIAYSSVVHMGLMLSGFLTLNIWGFLGTLIMMLAHGLCSSGLFVLVNINYERFFSRSIYVNKGLLNIMPFMSLFWFLLVIFNMAAPPSLNLLGEILLISSMISYSYVCMGLMMLLSFFSSMYCLFLYSYSQHGKFFGGLFSLKMISYRDFLLIFLHLYPLILMLLKSEVFIM